MLLGELFQAGEECSVTNFLPFALAVVLRGRGRDAFEEFISGEFATLLTRELAPVILRLQKGDAKGPGLEVAAGIEGIPLLPENEAGLLSKIIRRRAATREGKEKGVKTRAMLLNEPLNLRVALILQKVHRGCSLRRVIVFTGFMITDYRSLE